MPDFFGQNAPAELFLGGGGVHIISAYAIGKPGA